MALFASRPRPSRSARTKARKEEKLAPGRGVFYSSANTLDLEVALGARHYSYRFAERHFLALFKALGIAPRHLPMPEYYGERAALAAECGAFDGRPVHLIFRSTEEIRLLKCAANVACFAWEFDVLKDTTAVGEHPFRNQKRMLGLCEEIWVPSHYTRAVLLAHGLLNVHHIPAPIAMPAEPRGGEEALARLAGIEVSPLFVNFLLPLEESRAVAASRSLSLGEWLARERAAHPKLRVYLTILNPEDFRKNLDALLRGFYYFAAEEPGSVLLVKALTADSRFSLADVVADVVRAKMAAGTNLESDDIVFCNEFLDEEALSSLYRLADFYLCAPVAEGQNLPLLEAMAHGVVPVTTRHTAMLDYITEENALVIADRRIANDCEHFGGSIAEKPFTILRSGPGEVYAALKRSAALGESERARMAERAIAVVKERYSYETVWKSIEARLDRLAEIRAEPAVA